MIYFFFLLSHEFSFKVRTSITINIILEVFKRKVETYTFTAYKTDAKLSIKYKNKRWKEKRSALFFRVPFLKREEGKHRYLAEVDSPVLFTVGS